MKFLLLPLDGYLSSVHMVSGNPPSSAKIVHEKMATSASNGLIHFMSGLGRGSNEVVGTDKIVNKDVAVNSSYHGAVIQFLDLLLTELALFLKLSHFRGTRSRSDSGRNAYKQDGIREANTGESEM